MDGTNASGRKISLLNGDPPRYLPPLRRTEQQHNHHHHHQRQHNNSNHHHNRTRSFHTPHSYRGSCSPQSTSLESPAFSPRSSKVASGCSTSSQSSGRDTPSPMTPNYPFDVADPQKTISPHETYYHHRSNYPTMLQVQEPASQPYYQLSAPLPPSLPSSAQPMNSAPMGNFYPHMRIPDVGSDPRFNNHYDYSEPTTPASPQSIILQPGLAQNLSRAPMPQQAVQDSASTHPPPNDGSASKPAKKKYPCPHAARCACTDTFTTSGHAARHGKKHTGEKNIVCPTCKKAFTRKDNMKQHERTHKGVGRATAASKKHVDQGPNSASTPTPHPEAREIRSRTSGVSRSRSSTINTPITPPHMMDLGVGGALRSEDMHTTGNLETSVSGVRESRAGRLATEDLGNTSFDMNEEDLFNGGKRMNGNIIEMDDLTDEDAAGSPSGGLDALAAAATELRGSFD